MFFMERINSRYTPLKPSLVEWKREVPLPLPRRAGCLETFLGGMETGIRHALDHLCPALKPSLVEWKLRPCKSPRRRVAALKPSLVEWKLGTREYLSPLYWP